MGEGVDPTQMCQSLVEKVSRFQQLQGLADPEILALFEEWLEELEEELISQVKETVSRDPGVLARKLGLSVSGVTLLLQKLTREGRI